jgi:hypothetical protein
MRRIGLVLIALAIPAVAHADRHKMGTRAGFFGAGRSSLMGLGVGFELPLDLAPCLEIGPQCEVAGEPTTVSLVAEASLTTGLHDGEHFAQWVGMVGARYTFNLGRWSLYGQAMGGPGREHRGATEATTVSGALGAGVEFGLSRSPHGTLADGKECVPQSSEWVVFLQADNYWTGAKHQSTDRYFQVSAGLGIRFPDKGKKACSR